MRKLTLDRILLYCTILAVIVLIGNTVLNGRASKKLAFVDISKLTEAYKYKKDLEGESSKKLYEIKGMIDSLTMLKKLQPSNAVSRLDTQLARTKYAFNEYYGKSNKEIIRKVWDRLNPTIEQFGKDKKLALLIGANGTGTVLYGGQQEDVTEELISYVNGVYEKGN